MTTPTILITPTVQQDTEPPLAQARQIIAAWLREQRLARCWSMAEMGRQLQRAAKATGDHTVPSAAMLDRYVRRWEKGKTGLTERYRIHYCTAFGLPPTDFGPAQAGQPSPPDEPSQPPAPPPLPIAQWQLPTAQWQPTRRRRRTPPAAHPSAAHDLTIAIPLGCQQITIQLTSPPAPGPPHRPRPHPRRRTAPRPAPRWMRRAPKSAQQQSVPPPQQNGHTAPSHSATPPGTAG